MIKGYKIKLHPTNEQEQILWQSAGVARWAYNWTLGRQKENYESGGKLSTMETYGKNLPN